MNASLGTLTFFFPMWNEEEMILRTVGAAREAGRRPPRVACDLGLRGPHRRRRVDGRDRQDRGRAGGDRPAHPGACTTPANRGLGGSVRTGLAEATTDLVLYTDADMPFDLADLGKAIRLMRVYDADIVSAYRFDRTGEGAKRSAYSHVYNVLVKTLCRLRMRDVNFAFKLIRREVLAHVELESEGSFIDVELLAKAQRLGYYIIQFGVDYFPRERGTSTLSSPRVIAHILRELAHLLPGVWRTEPLPEHTLRHR